MGVELTKEVSGTSVKLYRYALSFDKDHVAIRVDDDKGPRAYLVARRGAVEDADLRARTERAISYPAGSSDQLTLDKALTLVDDPLGPFWLIGGMPSESEATGRGAIYRWTIGDGKYQRLIECRLDPASGLPAECRMRDVTSGEEVVATYTFGAGQEPGPVSSGKPKRLEDLAGSDLEDAFRQSATIEALRQLSARQVPGPTYATDPFTGTPDDWLLTGGVQRLDSLKELRQKAGKPFPAIPASWPKPSSIEFRIYPAYPPSGTAEHPQARLMFEAPGERWRLTFDWDTSAQKGWDLVRKGADSVVRVNGRNIAEFDADQTTAASSADWVEPSMPGHVEIISSAKHAKAMKKVRELLASK
jgi:hypothetical protein